MCLCVQLNNYPCVQHTIFETVVVGIDDPADPVAVRVPGVAVEREAMAHPVVHHPAEAQSQKLSVLKDIKML